LVDLPTYSFLYLPSPPKQDSPKPFNFDFLFNEQGGGWQIIFKERIVTKSQNQVNDMAKTSRKQIDLDEKRIMAELEKNSNESLNVLAKRLRFSRQKLWRVIKNLEKNRAIWGYTAVVDNEVRSLKGYVLMLKQSGESMDEKTLDLFTSQQMQDNLGVTIENMFYMHGEYDWILSFTASDIREAKKLCEALLTSYPGVFARMSLMETLVAVRNHHVANPNAKKLKEFL
jgi:DNA-binding Lrp family transcriptional regulator